MKKAPWPRALTLTAFGFSLGAVLAVWQAESSTPAAAKVAAASSTTSAEMTTGVKVGGAFSLTDHNGKSVTEKSWPGKYKLVFFGYTSCPDTCPATLQKITTVIEHADPKGERIAPLFMTVDPERDTPDRLKLYLQSYNPHIVGLTGTTAQVKAAEETYRVYAAKKPGQNKDDYLDYLEDHSAYVYLMSPDDKLLQTFSSDDAAENIITKVNDSVK